MNEQSRGIEAIREGIADVIPIGLLTSLTWNELELTVRVKGGGGRSIEFCARLCDAIEHQATRSLLLAPPFIPLVAREGLRIAGGGPLDPQGEHQLPRCGRLAASPPLLAGPGELLARGAPPLPPLCLGPLPPSGHRVPELVLVCVCVLRVCVCVLGEP